MMTDAVVGDVGCKWSRARRAGCATTNGKEGARREKFLGKRYVIGGCIVVAQGRGFSLLTCRNVTMYLTDRQLGQGVRWI